MRLRFVEDRRTLVWAFLLFPLGPALALWRPSLVPWLAPLLLYCSYLAGVLTHNHNHCSVFRGRTPNLLYGAWLSFFYGFPIFSWVPTHNQNHHRYLNGDGDITQTSRYSDADTLGVALTYPLASTRYQMPVVLEYVRAAFQRRSPLRFRILIESAAVLGGHAGCLGLALWLHGLRAGAFTYALSVGLPALLGTYWMMLTNYLQHVGCDARSEHDHSRNFVSPLWNWFVFDNGYHTAHHQHPALHWSRYRALHRLRAPRVAESLNHASIVGYFLRRYGAALSSSKRASSADGSRPMALRISVATNAPVSAPPSIQP
jgi:fatty acid desaturase